MNEAANIAQSTQYSKFVWRRAQEPIQVGGLDLPPQVWYFLLFGVLAVALFYVIWMYIKDARGIGVLWAGLLGILPLSVYAILAWVFLLPAKQQFNETTSKAEVLVLFDVSDSLNTSDDLPTGKKGEKLRTRMENVLAFLTDDKAAFFDNLQKKNPVTAYRYGTTLDPDYLFFQDGEVLTRDIREKPPAKPGDVVEEEISRKPLPLEYWEGWLSPRQGVRDAGMDEPQRRRLTNLDATNKQMIKQGLTRGTNIGESMLAALNKKLNSRLQGVVVFTDGRNNEGLQSAFRELETRAKSARIPVFVVGVGEDRQKIKIEIVELRIPPTIQPDDRFRAVTDIIGEGLAGKKLDVTTEITHVRTYKEKVKGKDGKFVEVEKEEQLEIEIIEAENETNPNARREKIALGKSIMLKPSPDAILDKSTPPRVTVEWQLDAVALATAAGVDMSKGDYKNKRWEVAETKEDSELRFRVRVPTDPREGLGAKKMHESDPSGMKVIKKPTRVLLMAAAANRDYQFVRTLLVRETEKKRMELAVHLQLPPGEIKHRIGVVQDVPPERLLKTFPDTIGKKKGDLYDLSSYDVIVAFDPDWEQMTSDQIANIQKFCEKGGGLVLIGGHINTFKLIRTYDGDADRNKPITEILPVVLADGREKIERDTSNAYDLKFENATPEMEFLKLDEELDEKQFLQDWTAFFYGKDKDKTDKPQRGFYQVYPCEKVKTGSLVVARYTDPDPEMKLKDGTNQPYIAMNPDTRPRVVWIASAETWRLREYKEEFHERFWSKLVRYAGAKSKGGAVQTIRLEAARVTVTNRPFTVDARIDGPDGGPLVLTERTPEKSPKITLKMPPGVDEKEVKQPIIMSPRPGAKDGWFSGNFILRSPGEYELTITVPKQPGQDSESTATHKFIVKESNPELDNTRPDYQRMYRMASDADDVLKRMQNEGDRNELKRRLTRPKAQDGDPKAGEAKEKDEAESRDDKPRLYFDLGNASLIPTCMNADVQTQVSQGEVTDMWSEDFYDLSFRLGLRDKERRFTWWPSSDREKREFDPPTRQERGPGTKLFAWVMCLVVGLFSTEWLIRKLLRLA